MACQHNAICRKQMVQFISQIPDRKVWPFILHFSKNDWKFWEVRVKLPPQDLFGCTMISPPYYCSPERPTLSTNVTALTQQIIYTSISHPCSETSGKLWLDSQQTPTLTLLINLMSMHSIVSAFPPWNCRILKGPSPFRTHLQRWSLASQNGEIGHVRWTVWLIQVSIRQWDYSC